MGFTDYVKEAWVNGPAVQGHHGTDGIPREGVILTPGITQGGLSVAGRRSAAR